MNTHTIACPDAPHDAAVTPEFCRSFPPLAHPDARVLILGSMPGVASLAEARYYAHPRNAFWPIMGELVGAGPDLDYPTRIRRLCTAGIALWDVLARCERAGSLDRAIAPDSIEGNDLATFLESHPVVCAIFFNGSEAERLFRQLILPSLPTARIAAMPMQRLPSTSPAHAGSTFAEKLAAWAAVRHALQPSAET